MIRPVALLSVLSATMATAQMDKIILGDLPARPGAVGTEVRPQNPPARKASPPAPGRTVVYMTLVVEPNERAYSYLIPRGWMQEGGVIRVDSRVTGGPMNSLAAKTDYKIKRDAAGSALMHWAPQMYYKDPRYLAAGGSGGMYFGMKVTPLMNAITFLERFVFPSTHPQAGNVQVKERRPFPKLLQKYQRLNPSAASNGIRYDTAMLTVTYDEGGVHYQEKLITGIEDQGQAGQGMWRNLDTFRVRAPAAEFDRLAPLFALIQSSGKVNQAWEAAELRAQAQRANAWRQTQEYMNQRLREIVDARRRTNAEIANDMYLFLTGQEEYVNPHTGEVETGSNQWKYRWQCGNGDVIYTDDPNYDPTWDSSLRRSDYKRSPVRPRP